MLTSLLLYVLFIIPVYYIWLLLGFIGGKPIPHLSARRESTQPSKEKL